VSYQIIYLEYACASLPCASVCSIHSGAVMARRAIIPDLHLHCQRTRSSAINYIHLSQAYLNVSDCVTHIWSIPMTLGGTHVHSSIQSLVLMRSATSTAFFGFGFEFTVGP